MKFKNREEAAGYLVSRLVPYRGMNPLVLAIPRGGAVMARILVDQLGGDMDVVLVEKLRAPHNPQLAIGSIDEHGKVFLNAHARHNGVDEEYLDHEEKQQMDRIGRRRQLYSLARKPIDAAGRTVIVVDDGAATGASMIAALRSVRAHKPGHLVAALAVAPPETVEHLREHADLVVCLATPREFESVGEFFENFEAVDDSDVIALLKQKHPVRQAEVPAPAGLPK